MKKMNEFLNGLNNQASCRAFCFANNVNNPLQYSYIENMIAKENFEYIGYNPISTFWSDLSIAEWFGAENIKDTYKRVVKEWFDNHEMFTEFVMVLNHKSWEWADRNNNELSELYIKLFYHAKDLVLAKYKGEKLDYFLRVTD